MSTPMGHSHALNFIYVSAAWLRIWLTTLLHLNEFFTHTKKKIDKFQPHNYHVIIFGALHTFFHPVNGELALLKQSSVTLLCLSHSGATKSNHRQTHRWPGGREGGTDHSLLWVVVGDLGCRKAADSLSGSLVVECGLLLLLRREILPTYISAACRL